MRTNTLLAAFGALGYLSGGAEAKGKHRCKSKASSSSALTPIEDSSAASSTTDTPTISIDSTTPASSPFTDTPVSSSVFSSTTPSATPSFVDTSSTTPISVNSFSSDILDSLSSISTPTPASSSSIVLSTTASASTITPSHTPVSMNLGFDDSNTGFSPWEAGTMSDVSIITVDNTFKESGPNSLKMNFPGTSTSRKIVQYLDPSTLVVGKKYILSAKFRTENEVPGCTTAFLECGSLVDMHQAMISGGFVSYAWGSTQVECSWTEYELDSQNNAQPQISVTWACGGGASGWIDSVSFQ